MYVPLYSLTVYAAGCKQYSHRPRKGLLVRRMRGLEGNVLCNDTLNTFYLWLYCIRHMVKDHLDSEKRNQLSTLSD